MKSKFFKDIQCIAHLLLIFFLFISGCSGKLYTFSGEKSPTDEATIKQSKGIIVYPPRILIEEYKTQSLVNKDGKIIATSSGKNDKKCNPKLSRKVVVRPDYTKPQRIFYDPGLFENNTFNLTLAEGMLTGINVTSTPDRGETIKNLVSAATEAAKIPTLGKMSFKENENDEGEILISQCNSAPLLQKIYSYDKIEPLPQEQFYRGSAIGPWGKKGFGRE